MGGLTDDGWFVADHPAPAFDLGPPDEPIGYYLDDEDGPRSRFPCPSYAGGAKPNPEYEGDFDYVSWSRACRAAYERMRVTRKYEQMPSLLDYRIRPATEQAS